MKIYYENNFLLGSDITNVCLDVFEKGTETDCNYYVFTSLDNSISSKKNELKPFIEKAIANNKKVLFFGQGDIENGYIPSSVGFNFKNNLFRPIKKRNEFSLTSLSRDRVPNVSFTPNINSSIGFCGADNRGHRHFYLHILKNSKFQTDFIIKNGAQWGTDPIHDSLSKTEIEQIQQQSKVTFNNNLLNNMFTFCMAGWGNYSYRFCQAICSGRIPILVNTNCVLPYEEIFDYKNHIVFSHPNENIADNIDKFLNGKTPADLINIQQNLYTFGNNYLTPDGFFRNIDKLISYYERNN